MKHIREHIKQITPISYYMGENEMVDEGLKEIFSTLKTKFKQVFSYIKNVVVRFGTYFLPTNENGDLLPVISPLTAGAAYKDGSINKKSTFVHLDKEGSKIVGLSNSFKDALKLYTKESAIKYWDRLIKENTESDYANIVESFKTVNEVKLHTEDPEAKYNIIVDDDELKAEIKMSLLDHDLARLMIWGAPGIGKTAILMNVLEEMRKDFPNYRLIVKTLSNETPDNFTLPKYIDVEGQEFATDVPKTWLPVYKPTGDPVEDKKLDALCGEGLLFVDELSRATPQVLNVVLPLVNEGIFNGYKLGSGWTIICATNRAEDEMAGQSSIGNALANRFTQLHYEPTIHTWRKWADKQKFMSPLLLQWLSMPESENMSGGKFYYMDPNEDMDSAGATTLMCTPRAWTNAMKRLAKYSHTGSLEGFTIFDIPNRIIQRALNGEVPASAVDSFMAFLDVIKRIGNFDDVVYDIWKNGGKNFKVSKKDLSLVSLPLSQLVCSAHAKELPTEQEFVNIANWLVAQNSDQLASYVLDVFKNVFAGCLDEELRNGLFIIQVKRQKLGDGNSQLKLYESAYKPFTNAWGIKFEDIPNYYTGLKIISQKYQAAFKNAIVDGVEALG